MASWGVASPAAWWMVPPPGVDEGLLKFSPSQAPSLPLGKINNQLCLFNLQLSCGAGERTLSGRNVELHQLPTGKSGCRGHRAQLISCCQYHEGRGAPASVQGESLWGWSLSPLCLLLVCRAGLCAESWPSAVWGECRRRSRDSAFQN